TLLLLLCGSLIARCQPLQAQDDKELTKLNTRIKNMIHSIDQIKWRYVNIYRLESGSDFRSFLIKRQRAEDSSDLVQIDAIGQTLCDEPLPAPNFRDNMLQWVKSNKTKYGKDPG